MYSGCCSMPRKYRSSKRAAMPVVPLPAKGSRTNPRGGVTRPTSQRMRSTSLTVGWALRPSGAACCLPVWTRPNRAGSCWQPPPLPARRPLRVEPEQLVADFEAAVLDAADESVELSWGREGQHVASGFEHALAPSCPLARPAFEGLAGGPRHSVLDGGVDVGLIPRFVVEPDPVG